MNLQNHTHRLTICQSELSCRPTHENDRHWRKEGQGVKFWRQCATLKICSCSFCMDKNTKRNPAQNMPHTAAAGVVLTNDCKYQRVCEVPVQRQLHWVSPQFQSLDGLCKADKDVSSSQGKCTTDITQTLYKEQLLLTSTCELIL